VENKRKSATAVLWGLVQRKPDQSLLDEALTIADVEHLIVHGPAVEFCMERAKGVRRLASGMTFWESPPESN
jgi:hypothetical protein